jgi:UDP-2,3-diacylglucosamine hydrolase
MIQPIQLPPDVRRLAFVSDLHLFSSRSNATEHQESIRRAIAESDVCVWGGDLFDFRWSRINSEQATIDHALGWLDEWYQQFPEVSFVFLDGNHDAHASFTSQLSAWSSRRDRFQCGLDCVRIDDTLLLHGDVIEGGGSPSAFADYRDRWSDRPTAGRMASGIYDVAIAARVHRAAAVAVHRKRSTCLRLIRWLHRQPSESSEGIRRIVFGHTHRLIDGYRVQGMEFYNGGAAIRHVPFSPVTLKIQRDDDAG